MQKPIEQKHSQTIFSLLKNNFSLNKKVHTKKTFPQMPTKQISHFAKQAVKKKQTIAIQLKPRNTDREIIEVSGHPTISEHSGHLILKSSDNKIYHLIKASTIRHIRRIDVPVH